MVVTQYLFLCGSNLYIIDLDSRHDSIENARCELENLLKDSYV
jgi:hypothetical protein